MKKIIFVFLASLLLVGCSNNDKEKEINDYVQKNNFSSIVNKLNTCITNIQMFPSKEAEEELIYYVKAVKSNLNKFTEGEKEKIYNILFINYDFEYNNLKYTITDYHTDLSEIKR